MKGKGIFALFVGIYCVFGLLLSACQGSDVPDVGIGTTNPSTEIIEEDISLVRVDTVIPSTKVVRTEDISLPNCGGSSELTQTLGTVTTVQKSLSLGARAKGSAGTEVEIPATAKLQLEVEIEATYRQAYQTASSRLDTIVMKAAPKTHIIYIIEWEKLEYTSAVSFAMKGEVFQAPYTYTLVVPKLTTSVQVSCSGVSPEKTFTFTPITPTLTPTSTPKPSPTLSPTPAPYVALTPEYTCDTINEQPPYNAEIKRGRKFKVSFTLVNTGSNTWPEGVALVLDSNPYNTVDVPTPLQQIPRVRPLDMVNIGPFDAVAPEEPGYYVVSFELGDDICWPYISFNVVK